jgi:hypothetical protein
MTRDAIPSRAADDEVMWGHFVRAFTQRVNGGRWWFSCGCGYTVPATSPARLKALMDVHFANAKARALDVERAAALLEKRDDEEGQACG